jgi:glyoxylase-like metal-dependent hydrolase (beta-lactamase superfamily II)
MAGEIPFVKEMEFEYDAAAEVAPGLRRIVANNPGPFTYFGTNTYVVGAGEVAILDPGPADAAHIAAIRDAVKGERVSHILVSHTHLDHTAGLPLLREIFDAPVYAFGPHLTPPSAGQPEGGADYDFRPDVSLADGEEIGGDGWTLEAVHTPGHCANHLCFALRESELLLSADHVMGWSTTIVSPPDGDMAAYMASLDKLLTRHEATYFPGHGPQIDEPQPFVEAYRAHRLERERQILACLERGPQTIMQMVEVIYADQPAHIHPAAARSVYSTLIYMAARGLVASENGEATAEAVYRLP